MNMKRIILISVISAIALSSLTMVSAGWFDFGGSDAPSINGITFNIPDDFEEVNTIDSVSKDIKNPNAETKYYEYNVSNGMSTKVNDIAITVISDCNGLDDLKDISYKKSNTVNFVDDDNEDIITLDGFDYDNATIAGKTGLLYNVTGSTFSHYIFVYPQDNQLVCLELHGFSPFVNEGQIEEIIK